MDGIQQAMKYIIRKIVEAKNINIKEAIKKEKKMVPFEIFLSEEEFKLHSVTKVVEKTVGFTK